MLIDYTSPERPLPHDPVKAIVGPRPIGWISSLNPDGTTNVSPYSFFQLVSVSPGVVMFSSDGIKNTLSNLRRAGEFVCNFATEAHLAQVNASSGIFADGPAKAQGCGFTFEPSAKVGPSRVAGVPAALECKLSGVHSVASLTGEDSNWTVVFGTVVAAYIDDDYVENGIFMAHRLKPLQRAGYRFYSVADRFMELARPSEVKR